MFRKRCVQEKVLWRQNGKAILDFRVEIEFENTLLRPVRFENREMSCSTTFYCFGPSRNIGEVHHPTL